MSIITQRCICGAEFKPKRAGQKHCSAKCRKAAYEVSPKATERKQKYRGKRRTLHNVPDGNENGSTTRKRGRPKEPTSLNSLREKYKDDGYGDFSRTSIWRWMHILKLPPELGKLAIGGVLPKQLAVELARKGPNLETWSLRLKKWWLNHLPELEAFSQTSAKNA